MIETTQLLEMKARMLLAAAAASQVASQEEPLNLDEESYLLVTHALLQLPDDLRALLAEFDVLRGAVTNDWSHVFGTTKEGVDDSQGEVSPSVGEVRGGAAAGGGNGHEDDSEATGVPVRSVRDDGETAGRPVAKRNRRKGKKDQIEVVGGGEVGSAAVLPVQ